MTASTTLFDDIDPITPSTLFDTTPPQEDWPLKDICEPAINDVLYGRGGGTNHNPGNKRFRLMVKDRQLEYIGSSRLQKPMIALEIVKQWRQQTPMGRFLRLDPKTKLYNDVGDKKAREKTSQALREKAPEIRENLEKDKDPNADPKEVDEDSGSKKTPETLAKPPTKSTKSASKPKKAIVVSGSNAKPMTVPAQNETPPITFQPLDSNDLDNFECNLGKVPSIGSVGGRFTSLGSFGFNEKEQDPTDTSFVPPPSIPAPNPPSIPTSNQPSIPKVASLAFRDGTLGDLSLDGENLLKMIEDGSNEIDMLDSLMKRETSNFIETPSQPKRATAWSRDRSAAAARLKQEQAGADPELQNLSASMQRSVSITQQPNEDSSPSVEQQLFSLQEKIKQLEQEIADKNVTHPSAVPI